MFSRETQALMEAAVDAVVVIDHHGRIEAVNDATCRTFGYRTDELLGENVSLLMPEPDRSAHDGYMRRYLSGGAPRIIGIGREVTARRKDGSLFAARLSVGRVPDSAPPRFVGMLRDVTSEHEATAAIKLERDRARAYLELNDSILLELDAARRVREINARGSELLGAPAPDIVGRDWIEFMRGESERERARLMLASALSSGSSREREFDCVDMAGTRRRIYWRCIGLRSADGALAGWLCAGHDVTEQAEREQHMHLAQDRLTRVARLATMGEMAAGISHELNQPLAAIANYAQACVRLLRLPSADIPEVSGALEQIAGQALRAGEIIRRIRSLVRNEDVRRESQDINDLIREVHGLLASDARVHDGRLALDLVTPLPKVTVDGVQIQQVLMNLVHNAFEAQGPEHDGAAFEVRIATRLTGTGDVEVSVNDLGPGLPGEVEQKIFEPFFTTKASGTGLGLAISRSIIKAHDARLGYRANQPRGACFYFVLPAHQETPP